MQDKTIYAYLAEKLEIAGRKSEIVPRILEKLLDETEARLVLRRIRLRSFPRKQASMQPKSKR